jgi:hypothetical protein
MDGPKTGPPSQLSKLVLSIHVTTQRWASQNTEVSEAANRQPEKEYSSNSVYLVVPSQDTITQAWKVTGFYG